MNIDNQYKRAISYFLFSCDETARPAAIKINSIHGQHSISVMIAQKWFKKFKDGESNIDFESCSGCPVNFNNGILKSLVKSEPQLAVNQIAERMDSSYGTVFCHLKVIEKVTKLGKCVPHEPITISE